MIANKDELTRTILRVIQRTADAAGNVTMLHLAEQIASELSGGAE